MYKTELMDKILKSPKAQEIIQQVSPIYGEAYTVLWLYQVIGEVLDTMTEWAESLELQVVPQTATWSLPYWEEQYKIVADPSWDDERRRQNIVNQMRNRTHINPKKLEEIVSLAAGEKAEVEELTGKNRFSVYIRGLVEDLDAIRAVINEVKPAHLTFDLRVSEQVKTSLGFNEKITASEQETYTSVVSM